MKLTRDQIASMQRECDELARARRLGEDARPPAPVHRLKRRAARAGQPSWPRRKAA